MLEYDISRNILNFSYIPWPLHSGPCQITSEGSSKRKVADVEILIFPEKWVWRPPAGSKMGSKKSDVCADTHNLARRTGSESNTILAQDMFSVGFNLPACITETI